MARSFDVFISYRRAGGDVIAQLLKEKLHRRGLRVFLDVSDLTNGQFEQALLRQIATAPNFVVVLTPGALDLCKNEEDWLRREIGQAIATQRNIVPVLMPGFVFPRDLPSGVADLPSFQAVSYSNEYADGAVAKLFAMLVRSSAKNRGWLWLAACSSILALFVTLVGLDLRPRIESFSSSNVNTPDGLKIRLRWRVKAHEVYIHPSIGDVPHNGEIDVSPPHNTRYTLSASTLIFTEKKDLDVSAVVTSPAVPSTAALSPAIGVAPKLSKPNAANSQAHTPLPEEEEAIQLPGGQVTRFTQRKDWQERVVSPQMIRFDRLTQPQMTSVYGGGTLIVGPVEFQGMKGWNQNLLAIAQHSLPFVKSWAASDVLESGNTEITVLFHDEADSFSCNLMSSWWAEMPPSGSKQNPEVFTVSFSTGETVELRPLQEGKLVFAGFISKRRLYSVKINSKFTFLMMSDFSFGHAVH